MEIHSSVFPTKGTKNFDNSSIKYSYSNGCPSTASLPLDRLIDNSIYYGLGTLDFGSDFFEIEYNRSANELNLKKVETGDGSSNNYNLFCYGVNSSWGTSGLCYGGVKQYTALTGFPESQNRTNFITKFPYNKIVIIPYVLATNVIGWKGSHDFQSFSLDNFYKQSQYPYIIGVTYQFYVNTNDKSTQRVQLSSGRAHIFTGTNTYDQIYNFLDNKYIKNTYNLYDATYAINDWNQTMSGTSGTLHVRVPHFLKGSFDISNFSAASDGSLYFVYNLSKEEIENITNNLGLIWTTDTAYINDALDSGHIHVPTFDDYGIINGNATGEAVRNLPQVKDEYDPYKDNNWDGTTEPPEPEGNEITGDITDDNLPTLGTLGVFNRCFAMNSHQISNLVDDLWNADDDIFKAIVDGLALLGGNPIEGIIDLRLYPFSISQYLPTANPTSIIIGRTKLPTAEGSKITTNACATLDLGSILLKPKGLTRTFMDYEPFSKYKLYIPYCGGCDLPANLVIGHTIQVTMYVDLNTGSANAVIKIDGRNFKYVNGTIGVSIPVTSNDAANYAASIIQAGANTINTAANAIGGTIGNALKGNVGGAITSGITGAVNTAVSAMDFSTKLNDVDIQMQGTASPSCSLYNPNYCYLLREYHAPIIPSNYGHCVGYECRVNGNLSSMSGYTVFADYDLSNCTGTDDEKKELSVLLRAGVYC